MESMMRSLLAVLLLISAVSAAQFTLEESFEKVKTLAGMNEETMERASECASRAVAREMRHLRPAVRELGLAVSCVAARSGWAESANGVTKTMEGIWKAYGH
ncbi:hypothetical protein [Terracidiphilus gabretensis]|uniref:hypothetical protein n=1 Tax=Terracidiphilus gabretensis TaxID=1577687 RepID=UPI00071B48C1|nr:hypothetical protein [Terracidiphilus gabretensis]